MKRDFMIITLDKRENIILLNNIQEIEVTPHSIQIKYEIKFIILLSYKLLQKSQLHFLGCKTPYAH